MKRALYFSIGLVLCILLMEADAVPHKKFLRPSISLDPVRQHRLHRGKYHNKRGLLNPIPTYSQGYDQPRITHSILKPFVVDYPVQSVPIGVKIPFRKPNHHGHNKFPGRIPSPVYGVKFPSNSGNLPVHIPPPPPPPTWPTDCHHVLPSPSAPPLTPIIPAPANPTVAVQLPANIVPTQSFTPIVSLPQPPVSFVARPIIRPLAPVHTQILSPVAPAPFIPTTILKPVIPVHTQVLAPVARPLVPVQVAPSFGPAVLRPGNSVHTSLFATFPKHQLVQYAPAFPITGGHAPVHVPLNVAHGPINIAHDHVHAGHIPIGHTSNGPINIAHGEVPLNVGHGPEIFVHKPLHLAHVPINFGHGHFNVVQTPIDFGQPHNFAHAPSAPGQPPFNFAHPPSAPGQIPFNFAYAPSAPGQLPLNFDNLHPHAPQLPSGPGQPPISFGQPQPPVNNGPTSVGDFPVAFGNFPVNTGNLPLAPTPSNAPGSVDAEAPDNFGQFPFNFDQNQFFVPNPAVQFPPQENPPKPFFIPGNQDEGRTPTFSTGGQDQGVNPTFSTAGQDQGIIPTFSTVNQDQGNGFINEVNTNAGGNNAWTPMTPAPESSATPESQYHTQTQYIPQGETNNSPQPQGGSSDGQDFNSFNSADSHGYHYRQNLNQAFHEVSHQQNFHKQAQQQYLNSQDSGNLQHQPQFPQALPDHPLGDRPVSEAFHNHIPLQQRLPLRRPLEDFTGHQ